MLIKFAVKNYRGFSERIEWDLSNPANYSFNNNAIKDGVVKNGIIYGPNGCGKTNFSLALFDIENHLAYKWKKIDYYENFIYAGNSDGVVEFEYMFKFDSTYITYKYSKNKNGILDSEELSVNNSMVFKRGNETFSIDSTQFPINDVLYKNLANNANSVSIINFIMTSFPLDEGHYLIKMVSFVNSMLWFRNLDIREFIGLETNSTQLDEYIIANGLLADFEFFLKQVSDQDFTFVANEPNDKIILCKIDGNTIPFQVIASTGTRSLQLLYFWIKRMENASLVFIDEFDAFYHFKLAFEVCKRLFNMDCQVFTSSHNTYLMTNALLRPDCYFLMNSRKILPLSKCTEKELREAHNIEKIYKAGAFYVE